MQMSKWQNVEECAVMPGTEGLGVDMALLEAGEVGRKDVPQEAPTLLPRQG